jgi:predicted AlkP superfamily pyrophosphatase or phosphodiesterase
MRHPALSLRWATLLAVAAGMAAQPQSQSQRPAVVVISLDGFRADDLQDPKLPVPTLRGLASRGANARHMTTINPTVTWPNHTAIVTGVDASRHGLLVNGALVRTGAWPPVKVDPWIPKEQMVHVPTVYDIAHEAGLVTAQVDWVAIKGAPTIAWEFPEVPSAEGSVEREMIARNRLNAADIEQFGKTNILRRDQIWTDAAIHILREHKPNLLLFHLLSLDSTHHTYGPGSLAGLDAMAFLDSCVARVLEGIREAGMLDRTTVIVVSDHGFKQVKKQIDINEFLSEAHLENKVYSLAEGGLDLIYIEQKSTAMSGTLRERLAGIEGVAAVAGPERYRTLGFPNPAADPQMSDLVLIAKPGYAFASRGGAVSASVPSITGAHGYPSTDTELDAIFIAAGAAIHPASTLDRVQNMDVAPTIAAILGIQMPAGIQGQVLRSILRN